MTVRKTTKKATSPATEEDKKKTAAKKTAVKKSNVTKKSTVKKTTVKKPAVKKAAPKKSAAPAKPAEHKAAEEKHEAPKTFEHKPEAEVKQAEKPAPAPVVKQEAKPLPHTVEEHKVIAPKPQQVVAPKPQQVAAPKPQQFTAPKPQQTFTPKPQTFEQKPQQAAAQPQPKQTVQQPVNQPVQNQPAQAAKPADTAANAAATPAAPAQKVIKILGQPTIKELAEKMDFKINDFIKKLMGMGIFATINQRLDHDMVQLVANECGFKAEITHEFAEDKILSEEEAEDDPKALKPRAPVVTIMGHVDHGKTSLLDAIRHSNVVAGEFGAITQHIGAYRVKTPRGYITFLDTPGHEAFTAMRARGAQVTDIVILVVSATDGIMPQTIEAMNHAKSAGAPIIVAINKIDLPGANPDRVKQDLANRGLVPEEWQGNTIYVEISAKKRINIDKLLEMIALQAEMMELKADPDRKGVGVILESKRDNKRGVVATVLIQKGTMRVGDPFIVGTNFGKIRALVDEHGKRLPSAGPSMPAEILGISGEPPIVGDTLFVTDSEKEAKRIAEKRKLAHKEESLEHQKHVSLTNLKSQIEGKKVKELEIILKADVHGSIEAIKDALQRIPSDEVEVKIIHSGAGNVNESDILLAKASNAIVIAFNVDTDASVAEDAEKEGIEIRKYNIIFELLEDIQAAMEGLLEPDIIEEVVGRATVRQTFNLSSGFIAGSYVDEGKMIRGYDVKISRAGQEVYKGKVSGLKRFKDDVKEVEKGYECGILIEGFRETKPGDVLECTQKKTVTRRIKKTA